jgi:probable F420-dependent oxidoreductase
MDQGAAFARRRLRRPFLAPELGVCIARDRSEARGRAQTYLNTYLALENYTNNLRRFGFGDDDIADGGSDRLLDALVAWGDVDTIRARVAEHLDAGADHVSIQPLPPGDFHLEQLRELAPALLEL